MYLGKTLFAQAMDFLPWKTFHRIVNRYGGDHRTRSLSCAEQFRVMAFAQLTYRESLRDIEVCLAAQAGKLYHMGISAAVARSTLADADESRDWRIYFELAQRLITKARALYVDEDFGVELANTVYALDATTIDLCLSMFPWAPFCSTKAAVKLHTLLDLRGSIPTFIHISDGKMHDVNVLDLLLIEAAPSTSWIEVTWTSSGSTRSIKRVASSSRAASEISMHGACTRRRWTATPDSSATRPLLSTASMPPSTTPPTCVASAIAIPRPARTWCS